MAYALFAALLLAGAPEPPDPVHTANHKLLDAGWGSLPRLKTRDSIERVNRGLRGQLVDFTHNNGVDRRLYSGILCEKRDLYVYLPPCFDPRLRYPLILWIHGGFGDETCFARSAAIACLDGMISAGRCPPVVVAAPDATITGEDGYLSRHSFFVNGVCGRYEDHLLHEVLPFVTETFPILSDRDARVVSGYSAGGLPAMALAIKHRELFAAVVSIAGPLNLRYWNCRDRYFDDFSPCTFRWQSVYRPNQKITRYCYGAIQLPAKFFVRPVFGDGPDVLARVMENNPADLLTSRNLQPGELDLFIAYAGRDNFNFDAHNESFLWLVRQRGIEPTVLVSPNERHTAAYCTWAQTKAYQWLALRLPQPRPHDAADARLPDEPNP